MSVTLPPQPNLRTAFRGTRALITGGGGFIAGHLTGALRELDAEVVLVGTLLGGAPRYSLHEGLKKTARWFNATHGAVAAPDRRRADLEVAV